MTKLLTRGPTPSRSFLQQIDPSMYQVVASAHDNARSPRATVIVPTHNRASLVSETIDALFRQELKQDSFEIIVVDNASTDRTARLLRSKADESPVRFLGVRMRRNQGPAVSRNVGVSLASGDLIAFTDSDCVPTSTWLTNLTSVFSDQIGIVQGRTSAHPGQSQPLFNHFIETTRLDGSFSTSNVCYRQEAVNQAGGFDPACHYWEDVDLGWRVQRRGWHATFQSDALVHHQVIKLSAREWLMHATHFSNWPAKAARYPEFRRHLFCGLWADRSHAIFQAFLLGIALSRWQSPFLLLTLPYLVSYPMRGRLSGRKPVLRAGANLARDAISFASLLAGSIRHRSPVF